MEKSNSIWARPNTQYISLQLNHALSFSIIGIGLTVVAMRKHKTPFSG